MDSAVNGLTKYQRYRSFIIIIIIIIINVIYLGLHYIASGRKATKHVACLYEIGPISYFTYQQIPHHVLSLDYTLLFTHGTFTMSG